jgi:phage terminase small subunit
MLTEKEERFCQEYIVDLNAAAAARRAGYSEHTAKEIGCRLLTNVNIVDFISELKAERAKRTEITADRVLKELAKLGFSNIADYIDDNMTMKQLKAITRRKSAAISSIKKSVTEFDGGTKETVEFKLHDKIRALEDIGKHIGFFEMDNKQKNIPVEQVVLYRLPDNNRDNVEGD